MTAWKRREVIGGLLDGVTFKGFEPVVSVYAIEGDAVVYVGSTVQQIGYRIRAHILDAKNGSDLPIHDWMRAQSFAFSVRCLETTSEALRHDVEARWIRQFPSLLNVTDGGPGMSGHKFSGTDHAKRIGAKLKTGGSFNCICCGTEFWRKQRDILLSHNKFCSRACYQEWQRGKPKKQKDAA